MAPDPRLARLRTLVDRLERLPDSPRREWMLKEARGRLVDVETGAQPQSMRPLVEEEPPEPKPASAAPAPRAARRPRPVPPVVPTRPAQPEPTSPDAPSANGLGSDDLLWLDGPSDEPGQDAPWRRGLYE